MTSSTTPARTPMFVDDPGTGLVIAGMRRYNLFTAVWFLGRHRRLITELARTSGAGPGDDAVDIGCGPGKLVRALGSRVGSRGSVAGIDPSASAVTYNQRHDDHPNHRYIQAPAQDLPLPDASIDVVTCTFVMHHIPEEHRAAAISEMWRVLRPGGRLLLADAHPTRWMRFLFSRSARRHGDGDPFDAVDIRRYIPLLRSAGFANVEYTTSRHMTGIVMASKASQRGVAHPSAGPHLP
ncbi:class I SAM-dependent methyltransferase [Nocardia rhamnosiphila]|uniref:class I SAM-dependent methyltransferase n=1 Tax=Nocardia rhamnosiphila TaxID=426716 RepID=UPI00068B5591|nr:class I SAM-dependent methyltransferase [Nocardia rhamnosiphila]